jgi:hypothetical protein
MAKFSGQSGKYVSDETARQRRRILLAAFGVIALLGLMLGAILASFFPLIWLPEWARLAMMSVAIFTIVLVDAWGEKNLEAAQKRSDAQLRETIGELLTDNILAGLPDTYMVINDLPAPGGNLEHLVVGPTGVFVLMTRNWRGVVTATSEGELLLNGRPTDRPYLAQWTEHLKAIRERVGEPVPGRELVLNRICVFTAARLEMKVGFAGGVRCLTEDQLLRFILETAPAKELQAAEVETVVQAFLGLPKVKDLPVAAAPVTPPAPAASPAAAPEQSLKF